MKIYEGVNILLEHEFHVTSLLVKGVPLHFKIAKKLYIIYTAHHNWVLASFMNINIFTKDPVYIEGAVLLFQNINATLFIILSSYLPLGVLKYDPLQLTT